jgi:hypothetical protein
VFSCSEKKKDQVLDMQDLTPHSLRKFNKISKKEDSSQFEFFNIAIADSCGIRVTKYSEMKKPMFPDRFMPKSKCKLNLISDDTIFIGKWIYSDSLQTMNMFFNWLDCFGSESKAIKVGEDINMQKDGFLLFVNDTLITYVSAKSKLNLENWQRYLEKKYEIKDWDIVVYQPPFKKAIWMRYQYLPGKRKNQYIPLNKIVYP